VKFTLCRVCDGTDFLLPQFAGRDLLRWDSVGMDRAQWAEIMLELWAPIMGNCALGIGCGKEKFPGYLCPRFSQVHVTDYVEGGWYPMDDLREMWKAHANVVVRSLNALDLLEDGRTWDFIWSNCVLEHLGAENITRVLEDCWDLLSPNGVMVHIFESRFHRESLQTPGVFWSGTDFISSILRDLPCCFPVKMCLENHWLNNATDLDIRSDGRRVPQPRFILELPDGSLGASICIGWRKGHANVSRIGDCPTGSLLTELRDRGRISRKWGVQNVTIKEKSK